MENGTNAFLEFVRTMNAKPQAEWDHLPDIGLYMDQVITFLERQLSNFRESEGEKIVTPSMINNYTKGGVIPKAEAKKYSQSHIALLILVCSLKQVLSIPDLTRLLSGLGDERQIEELYSSFRAGFAQSMNVTGDLVAEAVRNSPAPVEKQALRKLALDFAIEAQARSFAAKRILALLDTGSNDDSGHSRRRGKKGKKRDSVDPGSGTTRPPSDRSEGGPDEKDQGAADS